MTCNGQLLVNIKYQCSYLCSLLMKQPPGFELTLYNPTCLISSSWSPSLASLQITNQHQQIIKQIPLREAITKQKMTFTVLISNNAEQQTSKARDNSSMLWVIFSILDAKNGRIVASGYLKLQQISISPHRQSIVECAIRDKVRNKQVDVLKVGIAICEDEQKKHCELPYSSEDEEDQHSQTQQIKVESSSRNIPHLNNRAKTKYANRRHCSYNMHNQLQRLHVENKITSEQNTVIKNISISDDIIIEKILFTDPQTKQKIASIVANEKTSDRILTLVYELDKISIFTPAHLNIVQIEVTDISGEKFRGVAEFAVLEDERFTGSKKLEVWLLNNQNKVKALLKANYIINYGQQLNGNIQKHHKYYTIPDHHQSFSSGKEKNDSYRQMPYPSRFPSIHRQRLSTSDMIVKQYEIKPKLIESDQVSLYEEKPYPKPKLSQSTRRPNQPKNLSAEILMKDYKLKVGPALSTSYKIRIDSILIKFREGFIEYNQDLNRSRTSGKFLQMYTNFTAVTRSDINYSDSLKLTWKLKDCEIYFKEVHTLTVQVCLTQSRSTIAQAFIDVESFIKSQQTQTNYKGVLIYRRETVGQIIINFDLKQRIGSTPNQKKWFRNKSTTQRIKRIDERLRYGLSPEPRKRTLDYLSSPMSFGYLEQIPEEQRRKFRRNKMKV